MPTTLYSVVKFRDRNSSTDGMVTSTLTALADPSRRVILDQLARGPQSVSQLADPLGVSLPAVLKHLTVLEDARLVETRKVGRVRTCQLRAAGLEPAMEWINQRHRVWSARLDHLDDYLKGQAT
jgi:DNA-binding transcriptional ArsR family regulator